MMFLRAALCLALLGMAPAVSLQDSRTPVPDAAAQSAIEKTVKELFKTEYGKRAPADLVALAKKLLQQGQQTTDDPAARFVLFREARDLAAQGGDLPTALTAVEDLSRSFAVDAIEMTSSALTTAGKAAKTPEALEALAVGCLSLAEKALAADRYEDAAALLVRAESAAKAAQKIPLLTRAQAQRKELGELQKENQRVKAAEKTLADQPDDPAACLAVGRFLCLMRKDWARGLPLLAKGSDAALQSLAQKDLANPAVPAGQIEVADGWWDVGDKQKDLPTKRKIMSRARHWYELGQTGASGLLKAKADKRLEEIEQLNASGPVVDLLPLIDPKKDGYMGTWDKSGGSLLTPAPVAQAALQIPYLPPPEYDLKMVIEKKDIHVLHVGLPSDNVRIEVDVDNQSTWGTINFTEPSGKNSIVKYNTSYTSKGKASTLLISVRKMGVTVSIDAKVVLSYEGDISAAKPTPTWVPSNGKCLALGSWGAWIISKMLLVPVSGQGKPLR